MKARFSIRTAMVGTLLCLLSCNICVDGGIITTNVIYINKSSARINFVPYKEGAIVEKLTLTIPAGETITKTDTDNEKSYQDYVMKLKNIDSVLVKYNLDGVSSHYSSSYVYGLSSDFKTKRKNPKAILPNAERSLCTYGGGGYKIEVIRDSKRDREVNYTYTFTEQDYLNAK